MSRLRLAGREGTTWRAREVVAEASLRLSGSIDGQEMIELLGASRSRKIEEAFLDKRRKWFCRAMLLGFPDPDRSRLADGERHLKQQRFERRLSRAPGSTTYTARRKMF